MLESLKNQTFTDFEVIIVDQNKTDILDSLIKPFESILDIKHVKTIAKGASNARNIGLSKSKGEIYTFPDDDCEYPNNFLEYINTYFIENVIDGIVVNTRDKNDGKPIANLSTSDVEIKRKNILKTVIEAGIFIKSSIAKGIVFDENLGVGATSGYCSDEGPDYVLRLLEKGAKLKFYPSFYMYHPNPIKIYNEKTSKRAYNYGKGRGYFLKKNNFGFFNIIYFLGLYLAGMLKSILFFDKNMFMYFFADLKEDMRDILNQNKKLLGLNFLLFVVGLSIPFSYAFNSICLGVLFLYSFNWFQKKL
ncbi:hypothetical protein BKP44_15985 [Formosa algae]|nr:hypothetical protein BKP44_15985 [Formosa algae]